MITPINEVRVHRFRDMVAFDCEGTPTIYMKADLAKAFARTLNACAGNINVVTFADSHFVPTTVTTGENP